MKMYTDAEKPFSHAKIFLFVLGGLALTVAAFMALFLTRSITGPFQVGEHGKGFAVVASEVRKLAEGSQTAAAE